MKGTKRLISFLIVIAMLSCLCIPAIGAETDKFKYDVIGSEIRITGYNGNESTVVIPDSLNGRIVTEIGNGSFSGKSFLKAVALPETLKIISPDAFKNCTSLEEIIIPSAVSVISEYAFAGCVSLKQISILSALTVIGHCAFEGCTSLKEISIPSTQIRYGAFRNCTSLENIRFLQPVQSMGAEVFEGTAWVNSQPEGLICIDTVVYAYTGNASGVVIPDGMRTIADFTFSKTFVSSVIIPDTMYYIGKDAFSDCNNLNYLSVPDSVISVGLNAFGYINGKQNPDFITYCYSGSEAENWSDRNGIKTISIDNCVHIYSDWEISKHPDCIVGGTEISRCFMCNDVKSRNVPELGHSWSGWVQVSPLTCFSDGVSRRTCTVCSVTEDDVVLSTGHKWDEIDIISEPDCVNYGENIRKCNACNSEEVFRIDPLGHKWVVNETTDSEGWVIEAEPTCSDNGKKKRICSVCDSIDISLTDAYGHKTDEWEIIKDPTAILPGEKKGKCIVCNEIFTEIIPPLDQTLPDDITSITLNSDATLVIDKNTKCLYGVQPGTTVNDVLEQFEYSSHMIVRNDSQEELSGEQTIGTGSFIVLVKYSEETQQNEPIDLVCVILKGDANGDGLITAADARIVLQVSAKIRTVSGPFILANDFDSNGVLSAGEARKILRVSSKLEKFE